MGSVTLVKCLMAKYNLDTMMLLLKWLRKLAYLSHTKKLGLDSDDPPVLPSDVRFSSSKNLFGHLNSMYVNSRLEDFVSEFTFFKVYCVTKLKEFLFGVLLSRMRCECG